MNTLKTSLSALCFILLFASCDKDPESKGCTDWQAANYDASALREDGSCTYNQKEQLIWVDGQRGGWNGDVLQGAFKMVVCDGSTEELTKPAVNDSIEMKPTLYLGTGGGTSHLSYFTLINETSAKDFAEGSLRMDLKLAEDAAEAPEFIRLFVGGKVAVPNSCEPYRRSGFVEISTHSFSDSLFTAVSIPIRDFDAIMMARIEVVCGLAFEGERNIGVEANNIRWVANKY